MERIEALRFFNQSADSFGLACEMQNTSEVCVGLGIAGLDLYPLSRGGDGFVVARLLKKRRASVRVLLLATPGGLSGDAQTMYRKFLSVAGAKALSASPSHDAIRAARVAKMRQLGLIDPRWPTAPQAGGAWAPGSGTSSLLWCMPFGAQAPATWAALAIQRYMHEFGVTNRDFGRIAVLEGWRRGAEMPQVDDPQEAGRRLREMLPKVRRNVGMDGLELD